MLWVAVAGPSANLLMAILWAIVIKLAIAVPESNLAKPAVLMGIAGIEINIILMVLNLLPLPPLDGGRMAVSLLPHRLAYQFSRLEPYGFVILLILMFSGILGTIIGPIIIWLKIMIVSIFGLYI